MILTLLRDYAPASGTTLRLIMLQRYGKSDAYYPIWRSPAWIVLNDDPTGSIQPLYCCDRCGAITKQRKGFHHWPRGGQKCGGRWIAS